MVLVAEQETFVPVGDLVLLIEVKPKQFGKIQLPDSVKSEQPRARVVAVGKGRMLECGKRNELDIVVGDIVTLTGGVHAVELTGQPKMMLCSYSQIAGIIRGSD